MVAQWAHSSKFPFLDINVTLFKIHCDAGHLPKVFSSRAFVTCDWRDGRFSTVFWDVIFSGCAINRKCRSHQLDPESIKTLLVPHFLIEKNVKYFPRAGSHMFLADGNFSQKGNFSLNHRSYQTDSEYTQMTSVPSFLIGKFSIFPKKKISHKIIVTVLFRPIVHDFGKNFARDGW